MKELFKACLFRTYLLEFFLLLNFFLKCLLKRNIKKERTPNIKRGTFPSTVCFRKVISKKTTIEMVKYANSEIL